jgi:hypothetical protein
METLLQFSEPLLTLILSLGRIWVARSNGHNQTAMETAMQFPRRRENAALSVGNGDSTPALAAAPCRVKRQRLTAILPAIRA